MGVVRIWQLKKVITFRGDGKNKVVRFFQEQIGWHPSVVALGDTNSSDATGQNALECAILQLKFQKFSEGIASGPPC